jgi:peptidoglycan/LPS O-acetylase OafA/YrhL
MPDPARHPPRLPGLEALRGLAALAVALHHIGVESFTPPRPLAPHAYLAVDLFFVLSGFVIALAYEEDMGRGLTLGGFLRRRLCRLYPLFLFSLALGLAAAALGWWLAVPLGGPLLLAGLPAALLLLPLPLPATGHGWRPVIPLNPAAWSLSLELWGNCAYALLLPWLTLRRLLLILGGAALALILLRLGRYGGLNFGAGWHGYPLGWVRFALGFAAGLLLCRLWRRGGLPSCGVATLLALALAQGAVWAMPRGGAGLELGAVLLLGPATVLLGATVRLRGAAARGALALGRLSYPIYIVHWPVLYLAEIARRAAGIETAAAPAVSVLALLTLILLTAAVAERWVDRPCRAWLDARGAARRLPAFPRAALQQAR